MSVQTLPRSAATADPIQSATLSWRALGNRYAAISAAGVVTALATRDWRAALVILALTCLLLGVMIHRATVRA